MKDGCDRPSGISERLVAARKLCASNQQSAAVSLIESVLTDIRAILSRGTTPEEPFLPYYYAARLMKKFAQVRSNLDERDVPMRHMAQILLLDPTRQGVLLQKRGAFKRQFAGTYSVSANAKVQAGQDLYEAAARAVEDEVGVAIDPPRLEFIGSTDQFKIHLSIASFYAFCPEEERRLGAIADGSRKRYDSEDGITVRYNPQTRSLTVLTVNSDIGRAGIQATADDIKDQTGVDYIFAFTNSDFGSLMAYQINEGEEAQIQEIIKARANSLKSAEAAISSGLSADALDILDSDQMYFVPWIRARCESVTNPEAFTTVLTGPYFPNSAVWVALGFEMPDLVAIDDRLAELSCVSGGKGSNTHVLRAMKASEYKIPETSVLTTLVYEDLVYHEAHIGSAIARLDRETDPAKLRGVAQEIRDRIMAIELPAALRSKIKAEFEKLGKDIAVRSSATSEDLTEHQAAGQAASCLHQITPDAVFTSIKRVWASLFADGFVAYRNSIRFPHRRARMAVLLQQFVVPRAAGVILSFDQGTQRPVYNISAHPGVGEGVVEGVGLADRWLVGCLCDHILQRSIPTKTDRVVPASDGGVEHEAIHSTEPSLSDKAVLGLSRAARKIHRYYREHDIAQDVDIEYVVDANDGILIVQARAKHASKMANLEGKPVIRVRTVDEARVPPGTEVIRLDNRSETAVPGAAVSVLQLDPNRDPTTCLPRRILVTNYTNNDYNAVFGTLDGVITTDGGPTSHASEHAFEKRIPCVVGSIGALEILKAYDGKQVTFDAGTKTLYLGVVPIVEQEQPLDVWLTDEEQIEGFVDEGSRHENTRPWDISKRKRPKVFIEDPECHCRRRSNTYPYFQLDYFYRAWDRQAEILNRMFSGRSRVSLRPQARQIKAIENRHQLVHIIADNDPTSIYYHFLNISGFGIDDLEKLFDARLDGFRRFAEFVHSLTEIDASNVEHLVEELLNVFSWMHFGFWLDAIVEEFAFRQLRYISNDASFHKVLREEAIRDLPRLYRVDVLNPGVPAGKILNLTREREKEIYAFIETVRSNPCLRLVFENGEPASLRATLETRFPEAYARIDCWSMRYKLTLEDIDVLSDTDEYIAEIRKRLQTGSSMSAEMLAVLLKDVLETYGPQEDTLTAAQQNDPNLYLLFRSLARSMTASECGITSEDVCESEIDRRLPEALARLRTIERSDQAVRRVAAHVLAQYPEIRRILRVSKMQFPLREDAHHLIVPLQRTIARMMIAAAVPFVPSVLPKAENVFDLGMEDFIALLKEEDPGYVSSTPKRWQILLAAEKELKRTWTIKKDDLVGVVTDPQKLWYDLTYESNGHGYIDSRGFIQDKFRALKNYGQIELGQENKKYRAAVFDLIHGRFDEFERKLTAFELATADAIRILDTQIAAATIERVKEYYRAEQSRLKQRILDFRAKLENEKRNPGVTCL